MPIDTDISPPSSLTLEALAQVIRAVAPEVDGVSFHDFAADTLWLSDDFLAPEEHQLVEDTLETPGVIEAGYGAREGGHYSLAMPVLDSLGAIAGVVRLSVDDSVDDARTREPLAERLAPVIACVAAEFERRQSSPPLSRMHGAEWLAIEQALDAERFELFLQPIKSLSAEGGFAHYEVLIRLRGANGDLIEPKRFLPHAVKRRAMPAIDRWVVRTMLVWLAKNRKVWGRVPAVFCINLAAQSMTDRDFISYVELLVRKSGLPPEAICFEVTERFASSGNISVGEAMKRLEALGCEVALDDFGRQSRSFGYLRRVPVHYFKIDSALVGAAATDRVARATISAIVKMAESLGVATVAEAVEQSAQLEAVRTLGVNYAQGYLLGEPQSLAGFLFPRTTVNA